MKKIIKLKLVATLLLCSLATTAHAAKWENFIQSRAGMNSIDLDSIRTYEGVVFAVTAGEITATGNKRNFLYYQVLYICRTGQLYSFSTSTEYPNLYKQSPESGRLYDENYKEAQFNLSPYCGKVKSKDDIEAPFFTGEDYTFSILLSETKISGNTVSIWTNRYPLVVKPYFRNGKRVIINGEKVSVSSVDTKKGHETSRHLVDCKTESLSSVSRTAYDPRGNVIFSDSGKSESIIPAPRTVGKQIVELACSFIRR